MGWTVSPPSSGSVYDGRIPSSSRALRLVRFPLPRLRRRRAVRPFPPGEGFSAGVRGFSVLCTGGVVEKSGSIIYLEDITVSFDGFQVLREVDFYVDRGELRALIGPNGAGKTTLLDVICGKVKPDTGRIIFGDKTDLTALEEHEITMLGIGRKFQTPAVFKHLTLIENLTLALHQPRGVWSTLFGAVGTAQMDKIAPTLATLGLLDKAS